MGRKRKAWFTWGGFAKGARRAATPTTEEQKLKRIQAKLKKRKTKLKIKTLESKYKRLKESDKPKESIYRQKKRWKLIRRQ